MPTTAEPDPSILVIEDDRKLSALLADYLRTQDYTVRVVADGEEGLAVAQSMPWSLIVLDVMLPKMDGFSVLKALRAQSMVPVLMLTGRGGEEDRIRGLDAGADDYLPKTASGRELLARIRAILRRASAGHGAEPATALRNGDIHLDRAAHLVSVGGEPVSLTPIEFDLLYALMRRCGAVLGRDELAREVRSVNGVTPRAIDVHVAALRRKLGDSSQIPKYIRTVRTVGYSLIPSP